MSSVTLRGEGAEGSSVVSAEDLLRKVAESASIDAAAVLSEEHRVSRAKKAREEFFRLASASGAFPNQFSRAAKCYNRWVVNRDDAVLTAELTAAGATAEAAARLASEVRSDFEELDRFTHSPPAPGDVSFRLETDYSAARAAGQDVQVLVKGTKIATPADQWARLRALYRRDANGRESGPSGADCDTVRRKRDASSSTEPPLNACASGLDAQLSEALRASGVDRKLAGADAFVLHSLAVLLRYKYLTGNLSGLQDAVPPSVMDCLVRHLHVEAECFASPLNARLPMYCSMSPRTDGVFGSLGSFFDCEFRSGSFEANPPFTEKVMDLMQQRMVRLLSHEDAGPLSFALVVPEWKEPPTPAIVAIRKDEGKFLRGDFVVPAGEHAYVDGLSGKAAPSFFANTLVLVLMNDKGFDKWGAGLAALQADLLRDAGPLSFVLVVPEWKEPPTSAIVAIRKDEGKFLRGDFVVPAGEHAYVDGLSGRAVPSFFANTLVLVLMNDKGFDKWGAGLAALQADLLRVWKAVPALEPRKRAKR
ncbi:hypothetical protein DIPPA_35227 [Diplonema papillatum]|nr:hypothetical protein DIPPA_35227 [Diplonema papillatum]